MQNKILIGVFVTIGLASLGALAQRPDFLILDEAPLERAVDFPRERLADLFQQASRDGIATTRLLEGGEYNVNIRHVENITPENFRTLVHPDTIDVWVVQEGSGTLITGGEKIDDRQIGGDERPIGVGDLIFIPAGVPHGMKQTDSITWLNIRFPEHRN
jgi:mannose-6-phosphate isomerase-like protein (cupin superfamily)